MKEPIINRISGSYSTEALVMDSAAFLTTAILIIVNLVLDFKLFSYFIIVPYFSFYFYSLVNRNHSKSKEYETSGPVIINNVCYLLLQLCTLPFYEDNEKAYWATEFIVDLLYIFVGIPIMYIIYRMVINDLD
jgi:hypothetical protein